MSYQRTKNIKGRNLDAESGINRVTNRDRRPPKEEERDQGEETHDSEEEQMLAVEVKRPTKRPYATKKSPSKEKGKPTQTKDDGESHSTESAEGPSSSIATHMQVLLAATYHLGFSSIVRPEVSYYIPSCNNLFQMARSIMEVVSENTYLNEMSPGFFSVSFYCYCGFLYYYQILRAKFEIGPTRMSLSERQALQAFRSIGEPESWPVPAPLIEFIRALGYLKPSNPQYSYIVPTFPDLTEVSRTGQELGTGITRYNLVAGIQRVPPVCCYIEFLRLFGDRTATFHNNTGWIPATRAALSPNNIFMSLEQSGVNGLPFRALVFSDGWVQPTEGNMAHGTANATTKRQVINRWNCPNLSTRNINSLLEFIGLAPGLHVTWINQLIANVKVLNHFFEGSTTLAAIEPICHIGTLTDITMTATAPRQLAVHTWYCPRDKYLTSYRTYDSSEEGRLLARTGIATGTNLSLDANIIPIGTLTTGRAGPFFNDNAARPLIERFERFAEEGTTDQDIAARFIEQVTEVFDSTGGRNK